MGHFYLTVVNLLMLALYKDEFVTVLCLGLFLSPNTACIIIFSNEPNQ